MCHDDPPPGGCRECRKYGYTGDYVMDLRKELEELKAENAGLVLKIQTLRKACEAALPFLREHHLFKGEKATPAGTATYHQLDMALWETKEVK